MCLRALTKPAGLLASAGWFLNKVKTQFERPSLCLQDGLNDSNSSCGRVTSGKLLKKLIGKDVYPAVIELIVCYTYSSDWQAWERLRSTFLIHRSAGGPKLGLKPWWDESWLEMSSVQLHFQVADEQLFKAHVSGSPWSTERVCYLFWSRSELSFNRKKAKSVGEMVLKGSSVFGLFVEGRRDSVLGWMEVFSLEPLCLCHSRLKILIRGKKWDGLS